MKAALRQKPKTRGGNLRPAHPTADSKPPRKLRDLERTNLDLIVVGGGISGAAILYDAALRGLRAVLIEKNDYASGTSQATSKLIHGGLRYLKNGELGLVRESLVERRRLAQIAPHAVRPARFLYPAYEHNPTGRFLIHTALSIYGTLSLDRNRGLMDERRLPGYEFVSTEQALRLEPALSPVGMHGAFLYSDYLNLNPERLCCEFIFAAKERGAHAYNYAEVTGVVGGSGKRPVHTVQVLDRTSGETVHLNAPAIVNATGPWADYFPGMQSSRRLVRSKGIHVITRAINKDYPIALHRPDGTHVFVIPWRGRSILGTTDTRFEEHPDALQITRAEVLRVLEDINTLVPSARLTQKDVQFFYGGIRPLTDEGGDVENTYSASRKTSIHHHKGDGLSGIWTVLGGKYTTSRGLAEEVLDEVAAYVPGKFGACATARETLPGGSFDSPAALLQDLQREFPEASEEQRSTLAARYGALSRRILSRKDGGSVVRLVTGEAYFGGEIDYLIENEDIQHLSDLYFRRSGLGTVGAPSEAITQAIGSRAARALGWNRRALPREVQSVRQRYRLS